MILSVDHERGHQRTNFQPLCAVYQSLCSVIFEQNMMTVNYSILDTIRLKVRLAKLEAQIDEFLKSNARDNSLPVENNLKHLSVYWCI